MLGTDTKYQAYRKRIEASKLSERKKIEEDENLRSEAEGVSPDCFSYHFTPKIMLTRP